MPASELTSKAEGMEFDGPKTKPSIVTKQERKRKHEGFAEHRTSLRLKQDDETPQTLSVVHTTDVLGEKNEQKNPSEVENKQKSADSTSVLACDKQKLKKKPDRFDVCKLRRSSRLLDQEEASETMLEEMPSKDEAESEAVPLQLILPTECPKPLILPPEGQEPLILPPECQKLDDAEPFLLLKSVIVGDAEYQCDRCSRTFASVTRLVRHQQYKEGTIHCSVEEDVKPSLPCNMCSRMFGDMHSLKRHKLLHVRDGRKCRTCGVLFCKLHSNILISSQVRASESSDESSDELESSDLNRKFTVPSTDKSSKGSHSDNESDPWSFVPLLSTRKCLLSPESLDGSFKMASEVTAPTRKCSSASCSDCFTSADTTYSFNPTPADYPAEFIQPHLPKEPDLPPKLKMFAPHCLTSCFLEVFRNYDYLLKPRRDSKKKKTNFRA